MGITQSEKWLAVPGYEGLYEVSDLGRVRRLHKTIPPTILKLSIAKRGQYLTVDLCKDSRRKVHRINRLVLTTFVGNPGPEQTDARHIDGDKSNNALTNLEWGTRAQNEHDKRRHGRDNAGERHGSSKLSNEQVREMHRRYVNGESPAALASEYGVERSYPSRIGRRRKLVEEGRFGDYSE